MGSKIKNLPRIFKTAWFTKAAKKASISDKELAASILQVMQGQADDLGGGVFKKRLNDNRHRSIIIAKTGKFWIYTYLFAKKDRDNIDVDELREFKKQADIYSKQSDAIIEERLQSGKLTEIFL